MQLRLAPAGPDLSLLQLLDSVAEKYTVIDGNPTVRKVFGMYKSLRTGYRHARQSLAIARKAYLAVRGVWYEILEH